MNVAFHALTGLAIGQAAASRTEPGRRTFDVGAAVLAFGLGVMSHGVLDGLPHEYPFNALGDALLTATLVIGWMALAERRHRAVILIALIGCVLPDVIDHVPRDLNHHLGTHLPELKKIFPWHGRGGSGSLSGDGIPFRAHVASLVNHVIVVTFSAVVLWRTRHPADDANLR